MPDTRTIDGHTYQRLAAAPSEGMRWDTPRECQGKTHEISFSGPGLRYQAGAGERYMRCLDRSRTGPDGLPVASYWELAKWHYAVCVDRTPDRATVRWVYVTEAACRSQWRYLGAKRLDICAVRSLSPLDCGERIWLDRAEILDS